jgi:hypothetical protein
MKTRRARFSSILYKPNGLYVCRVLPLYLIGHHRIVPWIWAPILRYRRESLTVNVCIRLGDKNYCFERKDKMDGKTVMTVAQKRSLTVCRWVEIMLNQATSGCCWTALRFARRALTLCSACQISMVRLVGSVLTYVNDAPKTVSALGMTR